VLPARYRMTRSTDFGATVKHGVRSVERDIVVHAHRCAADRRSAETEPGPRIGLVVGKAVGSSVQRHRVARRLRHVARHVISELQPGDLIVIRALPSSRYAISARLEQELRASLTRAKLLQGGRA
jgi:ribonuclease P protein component